jgi:hypothetical protein
VDASTLIALSALAVSAVSPSVGVIASRAKRDGKLDAAIERLTAITEDHEARLRKGKL